ncbi:serine/threonine-protein kinase [Cryptococcus neoformans]|nr:serine/threonine-protein kinase [Cryptococcus neoformans var. grubii Bt1]OXG30168.1 serine/threonine-protein kinase [Cryptococcus neoformans var. grubii Ze90-1]OXH38676.1 serine/threonine-protein kinase [Cryptococcus neoformans var. grubii]
MPSSSNAHDDGATNQRQATVTRKRTNGSGTRDEKQYIGQWRIGRTIGKGSSGRVKIAKHAVTGKYAAIKIVPKGLILNSRMSMSEAGARADKVLLGIEREIVIMKLIDHPNVLNLYDVWETSSELYLIMEYVPGGELFDYLVKRGRLPVSEALHYFQQIIYAVDYCHRFNICHRDLKPENLLLDKDKNIKVADFGMAAWEAGERMLETSCGSPHYASPEIVAGKAYHGSSSDIWSCGIILFALLTGRLPFDDDNIRSLLQKVKIGIFEMPDEIKDPARDLLKRMLEKDPEKRITMPEILSHPFFVSRPPRPIPGRSLVSPPTLDEVERPVNSVDEIDPDIMGNLKTLWSGVSDQEIIKALMCKDKTWEKTIYHLLIKYRNKHLENYNMEEEEYPDARERRQTRKQLQSSSSPARRKGVPAQDQSARLAPLGENETVANTPVKRPQAPTPNKASRKAPPECPTPTKQVSQARGPAGPRPPNSRGTSGASNSSQAPAIVLQGATPTKELPSPHTTSSRPRPEVITTPTSPAPLNVPRVEDANLQTFLNQIADQMNRFSARSSVASQSSTSSSAVLGSDYQACLAFAAGVTPSANPSSSVTENVIEEQGQFEDAADDQTDAEVASIHSGFTASIAPQSPLTGLGLGAPSAVVRPGLHPVAGPNQQRWSYASSAGSSYQGSSVGSYAPVESPQYIHSPVEVQAPVLQAERSAPRPPPRATRPAPPPISRPLPFSPAQHAYSEPTESLLPRDTSYVIIENSELPSDASLSSWGSKSSGFKAHRGLDGFGMLKKKKLSVESVPFSSGGLGSSATSPFNSPKRSWFNNLFNFKPATCTLLSRDNVSNTREKMRKILLSIGVRTAVTEIDGHKALKCRLDEVRDNGNVTTKGVRFRVEFTRASTSQAYSTLVTLTQEKGAESLFRACFSELKHFMDSQPSTPTTLSLNRSSVEQSRSVNSSNLLPAQSYQQQRYSATSADASAGAPTSPLLSAPPIRYTASAPTTPVIDSSPRFTSPYLQLPVSPQSLQMPSY